MYRGGSSGRSGIVARTTLTLEEQRQIQRLANICTEFEPIQIKLNYDMLAGRAGKRTDDFLFYHYDLLLGFLGVYQFGRPEAEISGMVHPNFRRQKIFSRLLDQALPTLQQRNLNRLLFIADRSSTSGASFAMRRGATLNFSEYQMTLMPDHPVQAVPPTDGLTFRRAEMRDSFAMATLDSACFGGPTMEMKTKTELKMKDPSYRGVIAEQDGRVIGKLSVHRDKESAYLFGFCVHPDHQHRGYGRQLLSAVMVDLNSQGVAQIELEVACENEHALQLYQSLGFRIVSTFDYFATPVEQAAQSKRRRFGRR
jgi:ribosomal protein S18 acetylase RimI-like enzyme